MSDPISKTTREQVFVDQATGQLLVDAGPFSQGMRRYTSATFGSEVHYPHALQKATDSETVRFWNIRDRASFWKRRREKMEAETDAKQS